MRPLMNHAKIHISIALVSLLLCSSTNAYSNSDSTTENIILYNAALADAKKSLNIAKKALYIWRDSGEILKKADKAARSGEFETAMGLIELAKRQGELALAQSKEQANAGPRP